MGPVRLAFGHDTQLPCACPSSPQTAATSANVACLLEVVQFTDRHLAAVVVVARDARRASTISPSMHQALRDIVAVLTRAGRLLSNYCGRGFVARFFRAGSDATAFEQLEKELRGKMMVCATVLCV